MTLNSNSHSTDHHESGRRPAFTGNGFTGADLAPLARADLDSLCHSVLELARTAPNPPLRIKLQHGHMTVELEWQEPALADRGNAGAAASEEPVHDQGRPSPVASSAPRDGIRYLLSPTVGTFYHAPEPGAPPFVKAGDVVRPGQPVAVLEVMKMMSIIEADIAGQVVEFLVPDAHPVEFQQRLIALKPLADGEV